ncbi:MAG: hypothetical protein ACX93T_00005 [Bacteroidota bacterium]
MLNEKITHGLQEEMQLVDEQKETLGIQKARKDTKALVDFLEREREPEYTKSIVTSGGFRDYRWLSGSDIQDQL